MKKSLPIIGLLALILVAALAAACGDDVGNDDSSAATQPGPGPAAGGVPAGGDDSSSDTDNSGLGGIGGTVGDQVSNLPAFDRQIIRTATVELTVDDVAGTMQLIETAAVGAGGFVSGSSLTVENTDGDEDVVRQRGTITIRVPAAGYTGVMNDLRGLVEDPRDIKSLKEDASEVTEEYTDLQSRLRNLEATESQYLTLLNSAATIDDILTVQDRLNTTRSEIEQVKGRIQVLDDLTAMATITVQLSLPPLIPIVAEGSSQNWARETLDNSWQASEATLKVLGIIGITAGVFLAWMVIPGTIGLGAWWVINNRKTRGEAA